ncbi:MAG: ATP-binding protein [Chloroflexi bacterium]|nr:ATP-binding protein [Chloroflexota bacterium]
MTRRAMFNGLTGGLLFILATIYPLLAVWVPLIVPEWMPPVSNPVFHASLLMASAIVSLAAIFLPSVLAIIQSDIRGAWGGIRSGGITGLLMGITIAFMISAPLNTLSGWQLLRPHLQPELSPPGATALVSYAVHVFNRGGEVMLWTIGIAILVNALIGGVTAWGRRHHLPAAPAPTLFDLIEKRKGKEWLKDNDEAASVGLTVGVIVGALVWMSEAQSFYLSFAQLWPDLGGILSQSLGNTVVTRAIPFPPLILIAFIVMGGVIVLSIKNPSSRFSNRMMGVLLGFDTALFIWYLQFTRNSNFYLGVSPFLVQRFMRTNHDPEMDMYLREIPSLLASPEVQVALVFTIQWLFIPLVLIVTFTFGIVSGLCYTLLVPLMLPRPVDRAARFIRALHREPTKVLPTLYGLFTKDPRAYEVLGYAAINLPRKDSDVARLAAAYHTLGTSKNDQGRMANELATLIQAHPEWKLSKEISSVMRSLHTIVTADSLEALTNVPEPLTSDTTSLPPLMVKSIERIKDIFTELHKVMRVNDLPTQLTFYNDALNAIRLAENFVNKEMRDPRTSASVVAEQPLLSTALERWEEMVKIAIKRLKGRADVVIELKSHRVTPSARLPITASVRNRGLNVAEHVRVKIIQGDDYYVTHPNEQGIEILGAGEARDITFLIEPKPEVKRLRLQWQVSFDDSIESARQAEFADIAEFVAPDKPFQKIFPIPYVTGTPLKDSSVFVGRQDIFEFVKENLLGAHQNNVIILHGQRRTGKTSVLYRLGEILGETHIAVLIDMQGKPARGEADFLFSIADDIVYALEKEKIEVALPERKAFDESPEFFFSSRFIRGLREPLGKRNLLLLFDEFEELQRRVDDKKLSPEIFLFLRNLMQHEEKMDFIFSGTHKLEELGSDYWSALFNIAIYKQITFLSTAEVRRLITEPVAHYTIEYDPLAIENIITLTAGHPYFTQLLLHEVVVYHNETERSYITAADIEQAVSRVMERGEAHFKYIWTESNETQQKMMRLLAEGLVGKRELALSDMSRLNERLCGCEVDENDIAEMTRLTERDILSRNGKLYRFTVPLIEKWVRHTYPMMA